MPENLVFRVLDAIAAPILFASSSLICQANRLSSTPTNPQHPSEERLAVPEKRQRALPLRALLEGAHERLGCRSSGIVAWSL